MSTKAHSRTMNAAVYREYGAPGVLRHEEVAVPEMKEDTIMVGVRAAAINPADRFSVLGRPIVIRLVTGLTAPKRAVPGRAFAGVVEAVGRHVSRFRVGDEVYGEAAGGAYADKVVVGEQNLGCKPSNTTFEEAAAVPLAGVTALQGLRDKGRVQPGSHVLINGAAGGVGTLAIQIGKALGSEVTAVCSTESTEMVRSLGADHVVDYGRDDFTQNERRYDVILDLVGNHPLTACRRALTSTGTLVMSSGPPSPTLRRVVAGYVISPLGSNRITSLMQSIDQEDLALLTELIEAGSVTPVIDQVFDLDEISDAFRHVNNGHARGRTIVRVNAGQ